MTLAAKSASSCSSGSTNENATYLKNEIEKGMKEDIEEEIKEEIKEEVEEDIELAEERNKRIKITHEETVVETFEVAAREINDSSSAGGNAKCSHPIVIKKCSHCGEVVQEAGLSVAFNYIYKDLRLEPSEIEKLQKEYLRDLLTKKKLILVLVLDHTLINSTMIIDLSPHEKYLLDKVDEGEDGMKKTFFHLSRYDMLMKLRPFIHTFLKEANNMFEMYIYTMGEQDYATEVVKLIDPGVVYFPSRVICRSNNITRRCVLPHVLLGSENLVIILDDTEHVWQKHKENLILMKRYHYFTYDSGLYMSSVKPLSEEDDEGESDGILASILNVLKRAHEQFFYPEIKIDLPISDVRKILQVIKKEILQDCKIMFSKVFLPNEWPQEQPLWKLAEDMGARCFATYNDSVTHVVAECPTGKVRWARENNKFVVTPEWIKEANYLWKRQKEEDFRVIAIDEYDQ